jgi:flagellar biosynthesis anti-sigma factor FlgM
MVTRITDAGALPTPPPRTERATERAGERAAERTGQDAEASAAPAVRLQLSPATQLKSAAASTSSTSATTSDEALVQQIRQRLESGQFHIDYDKVGEGMLRDLIAQSLHRTRQ